MLTVAEIKEYVSRLGYKPGWEFVIYEGRWEGTHCVILTVAEISEYVSRLGYKPGWEFVIYEGRWEGTHCVIRTQVEDSFNPGTMITLDVHSMMPPMRDEAAIDEWLMWRLGRLEIHEMREFFKLDGKVVNSPHKPLADHDVS